jgi:hypothetical protein
MKTITAILIVGGIVLVCLLGCAASLLGLKRIDAWCSRQLTDGQSEMDATH